MSNEWVMVPREPTRDMIDAAQNAPGNASYLYHVRVYRAMLDAAPAAPQEKAEPVGYFLFNSEWNVWEQMAAKFQNDSDAVQLYRHPPAAEVQRLREALKPFAAIDLTTNQAVDAMDVLRARRALDGK